MTHVLDTDGVSTHLFQCLAKDTRKLEAARIFIPTTIVFESGFASAWYYSTSTMEVKQHNHKSITAQMIFDALVPGGDACSKEIVAAFIECPSAQQQREREHGEGGDALATSMSSSRRSHGGGGGEATNAPVAHPILTSYFSPKELHDFLFSPRQKPRGILQRFEYPKGWCNSCIQVTWSPSVTLCEAFRNPNSLADRAKSTAERCATFESKQATPMALSNSATAAIGTLCELLVGHLQAVEPVQVTGMILHLKITAKNRVTLLYSTCLRVVAKKAFGGLAGEPRAVAVGQTFMTRADHELQQELRAHLALFGPKPRQHEDGSPARASRAKPSGTPSPGGSSASSPPRRLRPLASTPTPSSDAKPMGVYRSKVQHCCSSIVAPKMLPSLVQIGGSRWIPARGKLVPIDANDKLPADQGAAGQEAQPVDSQELNAALSWSQAQSAQSRVSFQVPDAKSDAVQGDDRGGEPPGESSISMRQGSTLSVASEVDGGSDANGSEAALGECAGAFEDLLYDLQRRATEVGSMDAISYAATFQGGLTSPSAIAEFERIFVAFDPQRTDDVAGDRVFSAPSSEEPEPAAVTFELNVSGIDRRKAFASAGVKLRALLART